MKLTTSKHIDRDSFSVFFENRNLKIKFYFKHKKKTTLLLIMQKINKNET